MTFFTTYGQTKMLETGGEGGLNVSFLRGTIYKPSDGTRIGNLSGLFVQYNFKKTFSLKTGSYFESKGTSIHAQTSLVYPNGQPFISQIFFKFDYLNLPILLKATFGKSRCFFVNTGPYLGILLKATQLSNTLTTNLKIDMTNSFKKIDAGLSFGCGFTKSIKQHVAVSLELRDNLGLSNIINSTNGHFVKTNSVNLLFGISYKFGERVVIPSHETYFKRGDAY